MHQFVKVIFVLTLFCGSVSLAAAQKETVFVSVAPHAYFVDKIAGDLVDVHVMVTPGKNPHTYEPTPRQMTRISDSALFFHTGVPFEEIWLPRIQQNFPDVIYVDLQKGVDLLTMEEVCTDPSHNHEHGHHHHHEAIDPHIWLSPAQAKIQAKTIHESLVEFFPGERELLDRNHDELQEELNDLDAELAGMLKNLSRNRFYVYHPAWGYFAHEYGLEQVAIELDGKEPSARQLGTLIDQANADEVNVIFVQQQFSRKLAESVAQAIGGTVVSIDPLAREYSANLRKVARVLSEAMQ